MASVPPTLLMLRSQQVLSGSASMRSSLLLRHQQQWQPSLQHINPQVPLAARSYFTNTETMKQDDPYAQLGLKYADGATTAEIKQAYKRKAAELHPDVNQTDPPQVALRKFQNLQRAYQILINVHSNLSGVSKEKDDYWRASVWRNGDRIAINRTDVAGVMKKRPIEPATSKQTFAGSQIGHPDGRGSVESRPGECLEQEVASTKTPSSSVGRGLNKWVSQKKFKPWNGSTAAQKANADVSNRAEAA